MCQLYITIHYSNVFAVVVTANQRKATTQSDTQQVPAIGIIESRGVRRAYIYFKCSFLQIKLLRFVCYTYAEMWIFDVGYAYMQKIVTIV